MIYVIFDNFFCFIGLLTGGKVEHQCSLDRSIGYYLEPLMCLGAFCKNPLEVNLFGVSNNQNDPSPELLKCSAMPILKRSKYVQHFYISCFLTIICYNIFQSIVHTFFKENYGDNCLHCTWKFTLQKTHLLTKHFHWRESLRCAPSSLIF